MYNKKNKEVWFDGREIAIERTDIWGFINNSAIDKVVIRFDQRKNAHFPSKTSFITEISKEEDLSKLQKNETVLSENTELLDLAKENGFSTCVYMRIVNKETLESAWCEALKYDYILADFDLPTNIPLELIIARLQKSETIIMKKVSNFKEMEVVFGVMEHGSDGVIIDCIDFNELSKVNSFLINEFKDNIELHSMKVERVDHIGMGMRACIDTTGLMTQDEGMIVGSTSSGGVFVCSETHYLPYMNLRPFRVNAGAVHSYVWMPDNAAEYISDLSVGSKVLCVNTDGEIRTLRVGRIKMEMRPLLLISGKANGIDINVVIQDDWHIRVMDANKKPKNATLIKPGDKLLSYVCEPGRHVGIKVEETIIEK